MITGYSPVVAVPDAPFENLPIARLRPNFQLFPDEWPQLTVQGSFIDPLQASPTDPRAIDLVFGTPWHEDQVDLGFYFFVRGVATYMSILTDACHDAVQAMLTAASEAVIRGEGLPPLDARSAPIFARVLQVILDSHEEMAARSLIAFMTGMLWLLSYTYNGFAGEDESPAKWAETLLIYYARLSYCPE